MPEQKRTGGNKRVSGNILQKTSEKQNKDFLFDALHIFVLFGFALAQPLFSVLSRHPEFFVARQSRPTDIASLVVILCAVIPLFIVLAEIISGFFGRHIRKGFHGFIVAALISVIALHGLKKITDFQGPVLLTGAAVFGLLFTVSYTRFRPVRSFITFLSPALIIFPALFLFNDKISRIVFTENNPITLHNAESTVNPVVMIVFDEFPTTSLMDENRQIDPVRYPNFSELGEKSYWFRNYTTVGERTVIAVPALLSGMYPQQGNLPPGQSRLPIAAEYPHTLFTLLGGSYDVHAVEADTMLCPEALCKTPGDVQDFEARMRFLFYDLSIVYLHIVLTSDMVSWLPPVTLTWKDFLHKTSAPANTKEFLDDVSSRKKSQGKTHARMFEEFVESITVSDRPKLYFFNSELPHVPYEYLPSGKEYSIGGLAMPGLDIETDKWSDNEWLVAQAYQRHLLQVGFVDTLLGKLLDRLKGLDLYERSLIIITADHGVSFWPEKIRRLAYRDQPMDILPVPLFIKVPFQKEGVISDRNVESVDVMPTLADILNISLPWQADGHSAMDQSIPERTEKIIYNYLHEKILFDTSYIEGLRQKALKRKISLFGTGQSSDGLFSIGPHRELLGRHIHELGETGEADVASEIDQETFFENVDPASYFVPAHITGRIVKKAKSSSPLNLAVSVNGIIAGVTQTFQNDGNEARFSAVVPEETFRAGENKIEVFIVSGNGDVRLSRMSKLSGTVYSFTSEEVITSSDGLSVSVMPGKLRGSLDIAEIQGKNVMFYGWASDVENSRLPDAIVIFANGKFFYSGLCNLDRPDVENYFGNATLKRSGFRYIFPLSGFEDIEHAEIRFFAVSNKGVASELGYPQGYKWGKRTIRK